MKKCKLNFLFFFILATLFSLTSLADNKSSETSPNDRKIQQLIQEADMAEENHDLIAMVNAYEKALKLCENNEQSAEYPRLLFLYGQTLTYMGDYDKALEPLIEAIEKSHAAGDKEIEARSQMQIGIIYFFLENWDQALAFYQRAEKLIKELGNKQGLSIVINNIANIYQKKEDYNRAITDYNRSLYIQKELQDSATICNTTFNIGTCYDELKKGELAVKYFNQAYDIAWAIHDMEIFSLASAQLGASKMKSGEVAKANELFNKAEHYSSEEGYRQVLCEVYQVRSKALEASGDSRNALKFYKMMDALSDSLAMEETKNRISEFQVKYETAEKEHQIELQKAELARKNILQWVLIAGLVVCIAIIITVNRFRSAIRKRNIELNKLNATKDKFFTMISHDLKNPAIAQRNALQVLVDHGDKLDSASLAQYHAELLKSADSQMKLLHSLLDWARLQTGRIPYNPAQFDIAEVVREEMSLMHVMLANKEIKIASHIPNEALAYGDRNMIATVVRNILSNAIKFSNKGGKIEVEVESSNRNHYSISIADNGTGMKQEVVDGLFRIDSKHASATGTNGEVGSGLGLIVCKELIERNLGTISAESELGKGTTIRFTVNKNAK